jgi:Ribbon-helix-helix protein, copG family
MIFSYALGKCVDAKSLFLIYDVYIKYSRAAMRTLVDIPDEQIGELAVICEAKQVSRAEVIRQAIAVYIGTNKLVPADAFGLWKDKSHGLDGLTYQEQARAEW